MNEIETKLKEIGIKTKWFGIFKKSSLQIIKEISKKWGKVDKEGRNKYFKSILEEFKDIR